MTRSITTAVLLAGLLLAGSPEVSAATSSGGGKTNFTTEQLQQIVAPVALYPDDVLSQVFMASTYPLEVVEADRWMKAHPDLKGDDLDKAVASQDWDDSVKGLTHFPDVLSRMSQNLDWTKDMGDAFLDQQAATMQAVQAMRAKASAAGNLKSNDQQTVVTQPAPPGYVPEGGPPAAGAPPPQIITIQPTNPQTVYVPSYPPTAVYGQTWAPPSYYYPSMYPPYSTGALVAGGLLTFGAGVATAALIGGGFGWGHNDVYVNNNYHGGGGGNYHGNSNVNVNKNVNRTRDVNRSNQQTWQHNPEHRRGVGYRDANVGRKYEGQQRQAARQRTPQDVSRGFDKQGGKGNRPGG